MDGQSAPDICPVPLEFCPVHTRWQQAERPTALFGGEPLYKPKGRPKLILLAIFIEIESK